MFCFSLPGRLHSEASFLTSLELNVAERPRPLSSETSGERRASYACAMAFHWDTALFNIFFVHFYFCGAKLKTIFHGKPKQSSDRSLGGADIQTDIEQAEYEGLFGDKSARGGFMKCKCGARVRQDGDLFASYLHLFIFYMLYVKLIVMQLNNAHA